MSQFEPLLRKYVYRRFKALAISGVRYTNFSYHDIGAITITIRYISQFNLWFEITMKHYYEVNDQAANLVFSDNIITCNY